MADRREERKNKLILLKDDKLTPKQRADFYYKMAKILWRELGRFEELAEMLEVTPDSYLNEIDFRKSTLSAMILTEGLLQKLDPAPITDPDKDGIRLGIKEFNINVANQFPDLKDSIMLMKLSYKPKSEEVSFYNQLIWFIKSLSHMVSLPNSDPRIRTMDEFNNSIAPRIRAKAEDGKFELSPPIIVSPKSPKDGNEKSQVECSPAFWELQKIAQRIEKYCKSPEEALDAAATARPDLFNSHVSWMHGIKDQLSEKLIERGGWLYPDCNETKDALPHH